MIVVGAPGYDSNEGRAYVFVKPGGGWTDATEDAVLSASDGSSSSFFGYNVAIGGDRIVVGAFGAEQAYVFDKPGGGWADATQDAILQPCGAAGADQFGFSVAADDDLILVGARQGSPDNFGSAFVYQYFAGSDNWELIKQLSADDGAGTAGTGTPRLSHSGSTPSCSTIWQRRDRSENLTATARIRTENLRFTKPLLCH